MIYFRGLKFPPRLTLQQASNLSRGHQNTHKILKWKKRTDIKYDKKARFDGQRFGKLKVATWNVRGISEKTGELQTELLKRKIDIAVITEKKEEK